MCIFHLIDSAEHIVLIANNNIKNKNKNKFNIYWKVFSYSFNTKEVKLFLYLGEEETYNNKNNNIAQMCDLN